MCEEYSGGRARLSYLQLINVWVEYSVDEADTRALVWILVGQLDMDLPETTLKGSCDSSAQLEQCVLD